MKNNFQRMENSDLFNDFILLTKYSLHKYTFNLNKENIKTDATIIKDRYYII